MIARLEELAHIDMSRVAVAVCQARKAVPHGMFASLTPVRIEYCGLSVGGGAKKRILLQLNFPEASVRSRLRVRARSASRAVRHSSLAEPWSPI